MTVEQIVEKFGEVRITRIDGIQHDDRGVALITREIVNNQVVEHNVAAIHYRVAPRDADPVTGATVKEALAKLL